MKNNAEYLLEKLEKIDKNLFLEIKNNDISEKEIISNQNLLLKYIDQFEEKNQNLRRYNLNLAIENKQFIFNFSVKDLEYSKELLINKIAKNYYFPLSTKDYYLIDIDKDIYWTKERLILQKNLFTILNKLKNHEKVKGFWIYGDFGVGKSYIMISFLNFIARNLNFKVVYIFWPDFVLDYQNNISLNTSEISTAQRFNYLKMADVLIIDDIGAEKSNSWIRNNFLLPIINYRLEASKLTFFISNYSLMQYEKILQNEANAKKQQDLFENKNIMRIIERIKGLLYGEIDLKGKNYRNF
ncbi:MAG: primosomal protein [Candidatus Hepatoplasma scabrum]|nr:MAG: primosomal protein [Candidatus Hepatoplasma sp.]